MNPLSFLLILVVAFGLWLYYCQLPRQQRGRFLLRLLVAGIIFVILLLAVTRRLYLLGALFALLLPFLRHLLPVVLRLLPFLGAWRRQRQQQQGTSGNRSKVASRVLEMELDHDSGIMYGTVLEGPMEGRELADLEDDEFIELLQYCRRQDAESARLLETYLDKRFGEKWRDDDPESDGEQGDEEPSRSGPMSDEEAYEILGLEPGADREAIKQAHRRLMQKVHPDRGGSPYLASRINAARSHLLGD